MKSHKVHTIGIYGYGAFGQLMAQFLTEHFKIYVFSRSRKAAASDERVHFVDEETLFNKSDLVIFAIPVQFLKEVAQSLVKRKVVPQDTVLVDVSSVKVYPLEILQEQFPKHQILGTHPIFGPQSVQKYGLPGSKIVLSNVSLSQSLHEDIKRFLQNTLQLVVIEKTPQEHDQEMAYIQGLSHFVGRALAKMDIQEFATETFSYKHLVELKELLKDDSWELFKTIQNFNPYTTKLREEFLDTLNELNSKLQE